MITHAAEKIGEYTLVALRECSPHLKLGGPIIPTVMAKIRKAAIIFALERTRGSLRHSARLLGINRNTLAKLLKEYVLTTGEFKIYD